MIRLFVSTEEFDPVSAVIRWHTACDWSHAGFLRDDGWTFSAMADGEGVAWRPPKPKARILPLLASGTEPAFVKALTVKGSPYDFLNILGLVTAKNWSVPGKFICDKLVFWAFEQVGWPLVNPKFIPMEHLTPRDILLSPYVIEDKR